MKYVISGAYYNWANKFRGRWFAEWAYWQRDRQLASGGGQRVKKRKKLKGKVQ